MNYNIDKGICQQSAGVNLALALLTKSIVMPVRHWDRTSVPQWVRAGANPAVGNGLYEGESRGYDCAPGPARAWGVVVSFVDLVEGLSRSIVRIVSE